MQIAILYIAALVVFVALDAVMLTQVIASQFRANLGAQVLETPRWVAAGVFYLGYIALLTALVTWPALRADAPVQALWTGLLIGLMAYGTYELTSMSVLRDWTWGMVATDLIWGSVLTGVTAWIAVLVVRALG